MKLLSKGNVCISIFLIVLNLSNNIYYCLEKYNLENLSWSDQKLAINLLQIYGKVKEAEDSFFKKYQESEKIFSEIKNNTNELNNKNNGSSASISNETIDLDNSKTVSDISVNEHTPYPSDDDTTSTTPTNATSFVQLQAKGPVEEETIWRALYDTQLRRSPPSEEVNVFSTENVQKEYEEAKLDAYISQIKFMQTNFERQLRSLKEELPRKNRIRYILNEVDSMNGKIKK